MARRVILIGAWMIWGALAQPARDTWLGKAKVVELAPNGSAQAVLVPAIPE